MKKSLLLLLLFAFAFAGCSPAAPEESAQTTTSEETHSDSDEGTGHDDDSGEHADGANEEHSDSDTGDEHASGDSDESHEGDDDAAMEMEEDSAETEAYPVVEAVAQVAEEVEAYPAAEDSAAAAAKAPYPVESADEGVTIFAIDPAGSKVDWYGFKPAGSDHTGTLQVAEGTFNVAGDTLQTATIVLDMTSIVDTDLTGGMKAKLEEHLMSADFFNVEEFPTATLVIKSAESTAASVYDVVADLTIKGITNEITFPAQAIINGNALSGNAEITIDRSLWDVRYGSGSFFDNLGDDLISNDIKLTVQLAANG